MNMISIFESDLQKPKWDSLFLNLEMEHKNLKSTRVYSRGFLLFFRVKRFGEATLGLILPPY